jgi:hypothetical protein
MSAPWHITQVGGGVVSTEADRWVLTVPPASAAIYHDAQISSYQGREDFDLRPPVTLRLRAWMKGGVRGTAGFGFWNHPYVPGERGFRLPRAVWFFYGSPPGNIALARDVPGSGWKAATFDAARWQFIAMLPAAPIGVLLMRIPWLYRCLWPIGQRAIGVSEKLLDEALIRTAHDYTIRWLPDRVEFLVDAHLVHRTERSPRGPLGFIGWIDNQYAVVTPQGRIGFGLLDVPTEQSLFVEHITIKPG